MKILFISLCRGAAIKFKGSQLLRNDTKNTLKTAIGHLLVNVGRTDKAVYASKLFQVQLNVLPLQYLSSSYASVYVSPKIIHIFPKIISTLLKPVR